MMRTIRRLAAMAAFLLGTLGVVGLSASTAQAHSCYGGAACGSCDSGSHSHFNNDGTSYCSSFTMEDPGGGDTALERPAHGPHFII